MKTLVKILKDEEGREYLFSSDESYMTFEVRRGQQDSWHLVFKVTKLDYDNCDYIFNLPGIKD